MKVIFKKLVNGFQIKIIKSRFGYFVVLCDKFGLVLTHVIVQTKKIASKYFVKLDLFARQLAF